MNEYDHGITFRDLGTFRDYLRDYFNIFHAIHLIKEAWEEVTPRTLRAAWRNLWPWPLCLRYDGRLFRGIAGIRRQEVLFIKEIITSGNYMGLQMERADVQQIIGDI